MKNINAIHFAQQLVRTQSKFDKLDNCYSLDICDLSDFDFYRFSSFLLQDRLMANEACGSDNRLFESKMLPSLISLLNNSTNEDAERDFLHEWKDGVTDYFYCDMQSLIDDALQLYNMERAA